MHIDIIYCKMCGWVFLTPSIESTSSYCLEVAMGILSHRKDTTFYIFQNIVILESLPTLLRYGKKFCLIQFVLIVKIETIISCDFFYIQSGNRIGSMGFQLQLWVIVILSGFMRICKELKKNLVLYHHHLPQIPACFPFLIKEMLTY